MWKPGKTEILFTEIVKRIIHRVIINWKSFSMKFWLRTTVVWFKPFVYVWKSSWVKILNCCKLSHLPKGQGNWKWKYKRKQTYWYLITGLATIEATARLYWNQQEFCHWFGQDWDFTHWNNAAIWVAAELPLPQLSTDKEKEVTLR